MSASKVIMFAALTALCCAVSDVRSRTDVDKMHIERFEAEKEIVKSENGLYDHPALLHRVLANLKSAPGKLRSPGNSFSWKNCGSSSDLLVINGLSVTPDPLKIPGTVGLKFDISIRETFAAPLKLVVELEKYEGFFWLPIPCINDVGSCTYDDLCEKMASFVCPKPFDDKKIPCKCPFTQGNYSLPTTTFSMQGSVPNGKYYAQAQFSYGSKAVNCIQVHFNID